MQVSGFEAASAIQQAEALYRGSGDPASIRTFYNEKISEWTMILEDQDELDPTGVLAVESLWVAFADKEKEMRQFKQVKHVAARPWNEFLNVYLLRQRACLRELWRAPWLKAVHKYGLRKCNEHKNISASADNAKHSTIQHTNCYNI